MVLDISVYLIGSVLHIYESGLLKRYLAIMPSPFQALAITDISINFSEHRSVHKPSLLKVQSPLLFLVHRSKFHLIHAAHEFGPGGAGHHPFPDTLHSLKPPQIARDNSSHPE
jgi:hypothetical protein